MVQSFKYLGINVSLTSTGNVAMSLNFKLVGLVIICLGIDATKVILDYGK